MCAGVRCREVTECPQKPGAATNTLTMLGTQTIYSFLVHYSLNNYLRCFVCTQLSLTLNLYVWHIAEFDFLPITQISIFSVS